MKKIFFFPALAFSIFIASCSSDMSITKRKYNKGYYVDVIRKGEGSGQPVVNKEEGVSLKQEYVSSNDTYVQQIAPGPVNETAKPSPERGAMQQGATAKPKTATLPLLAQVIEKPSYAHAEKVGLSSGWMHRSSGGPIYTIFIIIGIILTVYGAYVLIAGMIAGIFDLNGVLYILVGVLVLILAQLFRD